MNALVSDLRFAARSLARTPGFTLSAALTLGLAIGANAAIFSLVERLFVRPLPFAASERLVSVAGVSNEGAPRPFFSIPKFELARERARAFAALAAKVDTTLSLSGEGEPVSLIGQRVTANYFDVLGVRPALGRTFRADEEETGPPVAVIGHGLWMRQFGGDAGVLGRVVRLEGEPHTIVGVLPPLPHLAFQGSEIWITRPLQALRIDHDVLMRGVSFLQLVARLREGTTPAAAAEEMKAVVAAYREQRPGNADAAWVPTVVPLHEARVGAFRPALRTLALAVLVVLAVACSNVAHLLAVRHSARRRQIALRAALGASRAAIVRLFLLESLLLALAAGALGLLLAQALLSIVPRLGPAALPLGEALEMDGRMVLFALAASVLAGALAGIMPALEVSRPAVGDALKDGGRSLVGAGERRALRALLLGTQTALSLTMLVGAGLLVASFVRLLGEDPGFDPRGVLTASATLPGTRYPGRTEQVAFQRRFVEALQAAPGVRAAGLVTGLALSGADSNAPYARADGAVPPLPERPLGLMRSVSPGYFAALRVPLVAGRDFTGRDEPDAPGVAIISRSTARRLFGEEDPVGRRLLVGSQGGGIPVEVVGVVGDVRSVSLARVNDVEIYRPLAQRSDAFVQIAVRTDGDPAALAGTVRRVLRSLDPEVALNEPLSLETVVRTSLGERTLVLRLVGGFAVAALFLALVGVHGAVAFAVGQRTSEIGVRMALGARGADVVRLVLLQGLRPVVVGLAAGLAASLGLGRVLASQLYGVSAADPRLLTVATLAFASVAAAAGFWPARRAARVDPVIALRE